MSTSIVALNDELEALSAIYDEGVLTILEDDATTKSVRASLALPAISSTFALNFPYDYPDVPPSITGTRHVGEDVKKGYGDLACNILRDVLGRVYSPGVVCLFDLIEEASSELEEAQDKSAQHGQTEADRQDPQDRFDDVSEWGGTTLTANSTAALGPEPAWILSQPLTVNKSTFIARSLPVSSLDEATSSVSHLLASNKKVASATHNITAWRIKTTSTTRSTDTPTEITIQDCDDDGETAAGSRVLHLMQMMDVWNCLVVVTRWYGGVKLGSDRFKLINTVARDAIVAGGFAKTIKDEGDKEAKKGKKK